MKILYLFVWLVEEKPAYRQAGTDHGVLFLLNTCQTENTLPRRKKI
jgi:hypothetical protein